MQNIFVEFCTDIFKERMEEWGVGGLVLKKYGVRRNSRFCFDDLKDRIFTISVSTASETKVISKWWKSFTIKAGKLTGEPKI